MIHPSHQPEARRLLWLVGSLAVALSITLTIDLRQMAPPVTHFLVWHAILEVLSIGIALMIFAVGWRARESDALAGTIPAACLMLGVGLLDLSHTLSYRGMPDFLTPNDPDKALDFWLSARLLSVLALLLLANGGWARLGSLSRRTHLSAVLLFVVAVHAVVLLRPEWTPRWFVPGEGLTVPKQALETGVFLLLLLVAACGARALRGPAATDRIPPAPLMAAALVLAMSGVHFIAYVDVAGFGNLVGHIYKIIGYLLLHQAVFSWRIESPYRRLKRSEGRMRAMLAALPDPLFELDAEGRYLAVHARDESLLPLPAERLVGQKVADVLPPQAAEACRGAIAEAARDGQARGRQASIAARDGERWFELSVARIEDADPRFVAVARDVTAHREAERVATLEARRAEGLLSLAESADGLDEATFLQRALDFAEALTDSQIGFLHFVDEDAGTLELITWSTRTLAEYCTAAYDSHYPIDAAGIWADAIRERRPVVINDYASAPGRKGLPPGHSMLTRLVSVPVLSEGKIQMIAGVGNRETPYGAEEVESVRLVLEAIWHIVGRRRMSVALNAERAQTESFFETNLDLVGLFSADGRFLRLNREWEQALGYPVADLVGRPFIDLIHPDDVEATRAAVRRLEQGETVAGFENRYLHADGGWRWLEWRSQLRDGLIFATARDVTARRLAEAELLKLSAAVQQDPNPVLITDLSGRIEFVNPAFTVVTGYEAPEVLGQNPRLLRSGETDPGLYAAMWRALANGESWRGELLNRRKDGSKYVADTLIYPVRDAQGRTRHYLAHSEDITERKEAAERIHNLLSFDQLTGLPNVNVLRERLELAIESSNRDGAGLAVLAIDLDNFKGVNESIGHSMGDTVLVQLAARLLGPVADGQTLARISGDEFMLVLPKADDYRAGEVARRLVEIVAQPLLVGGREVVITASVGIALHPRDGVDADTLIRNAQAAMRRVKQDSRNGYRHFAADIDPRSQSTFLMGSALHGALARGQLRLVFQPQIDLRRGRPIALETLLRWRHPELGEVSPAEFIPVAEASGMILPIGQWVIETALTKLAEWQRQGLRELVVAVNVSPVQFRHPDFLASVERALELSGADPSGFEVEVTEAAAMHDPDAAGRVLEQLHGRGVRLSIDDFGTGYSSLSQIKRFRISKLKIDQSFIRGLPGDPGDQAIVVAVVQMARGLGISTLAEGVETAEQVEFLHQHGCSGAQGYFFSRPLEAEDAERYLREHWHRG